MQLERKLICSQPLRVPSDWQGGFGLVSTNACAAELTWNPPAPLQGAATMRLGVCSSCSLGSDGVGY